MRGLDYSRESYVRLYRRDTPEFLALSWLARLVFPAVVRVLDRAGRLPVGALGLRGLALALHAPWDEVRAALEELEREGWIRIEDGFAVDPEYVAREETASAPAQRQRDSRERARAGVVPVDKVLEESRPVTGGHDPSRAVTNGHSVPYRTVQYQGEIARAPAREEPTARVREPPTERELEYERSYVAGVERGKRGPFALDGRQRGELHQAITTYARDRGSGEALRAKNLDGWIERMSAEFAEDLVERARGDPKVIEVHAAFQPRGFLRWLNVASVGVEAAGGAR